MLFFALYRVFNRCFLTALLKLMQSEDPYDHRFLSSPRQGMKQNFRPNLINMCNIVGAKLFSNLQQMAIWIIREEKSAIYWEHTEIQFQRVKRL